MILIISEYNDHTTYQVETWLQFFNLRYVRINADDHVTIESIILDNDKIDFSICVNSIQIKYSEIASVWYRRGLIDIFSSLLSSTNNVSIKEFDRELFNCKKEELIKIHEFIHTLLLKKRSISSFNTEDINKLTALLLAREVGLYIPSSIVGTQNIQIKSFAGGKPLISKAIRGSAPNFSTDDYSIRLYVDLLGDAIEETFFPSLVQIQLSKKYEIRTFFLNGTFHSMAIFSQSNEQTKIDFRNQGGKTTRTVPYKLPEEIESKLLILMNKLNLNSGSIDLVYTLDNEFIFLEVNPIGQLGMVSIPCNYNLEKKIASSL